MVLTLIKLKWIHSHQLIVHLVDTLQLFAQALDLLIVELWVRLDVANLIDGFRASLEVAHDVLDEEVAIVHQNSFDLLLEI